MGSQVDPALSAKRAEAGRKGGHARWANRSKPATTWRDGLLEFRNSKPKDYEGLRVSNVTAEESETAELWLFDEIDGTGWWGVSAKDVQTALNSITASAITLHLNSPGGDVFEAHAIYNAIKAHPANVTVQVEGIAASAASYVAMAGDTVLVASNATFMIHDAITFTYGNEADHTKASGVLGQQSDIIARIYAERSGGEADDFRAAMREETYYDAASAIEAGLADGLLEHPDTGGNVADAAKVGLFASAAKLLEATTSTDKTEPDPAGTEDEPDPLAGVDFDGLADALKGALA